MPSLSFHSQAKHASSLLQAPWRCLILGGGGHGRVVIEILQLTPEVRPVAVLDQDRNLWGRELLGVPVRGDDAMVSELVQEGANSFVVGLGSVRDNAPRRRLYELGVAHGLAPLRLSHPSSIRAKSAEVGVGSVLFPLAVVNTGAKLGVNVIVNTGAIVEHDCVVGDHVHVATGARLASSVRIGACAHIGVGAVVRQCVSIGEYAVVGAGAVVVKDVPPCTVVAGVPARPLEQRE
jgi:UDP-perosamine 4-acetyltransferase